MNDFNFFSSNFYIYLPTKKNAKVALSIDSPLMARNSFKLYNPFSTKAKILKFLMRFCFVNLNFACKYLIKNKMEKSAFAHFLEHELNTPLIISIYFATANDKVVLQLQSVEGKLMGYLKYPISDIGLKHIKNETKAFEILSDKRIIEPYIFKKEYKGRHFLLLQPLDGKIGFSDTKDINNLLENFKRREQYRLSRHPRIINLKKKFLKNNMIKYIKKLEDLCRNSDRQYRLVYEHGDFTPWNIINLEGKTIPFDFEYFEEDGIEYFDIIKYYYQVGKLLKNMVDRELVKYIELNVKFEEFSIIIQLFLLNEIMKNIEENKSSTFEKSMLDVLEKL